MGRATPSPLLYAHAVRRALRGRRPAAHRLFKQETGRTIFVFGCPRSGTTFLAGALGSLTGHVDLGEVAPLKAAIPRLAAMELGPAGDQAKRMLGRVRRLSFTSGLVAVEQTPESVYIAHALMRAYPNAVFLHLIRDGRDVVCSLEERGWLAASRTGEDDAGQAYGSSSRFWVEPERAAEFAQVDDVRRAAWAWRRYVEAGRALGEDAIELRYEELTSRPHDVATRLGEVLQHPVDELADALSQAHEESVGRYKGELTATQLAEVELEAGALLRALRYIPATGS